MTSKSNKVLSFVVVEYDLLRVHERVTEHQHQKQKKHQQL
jgi:hypothetical protein